MKWPFSDLSPDQITRFASQGRWDLVAHASSLVLGKKSKKRKKSDGFGTFASQGVEAEDVEALAGPINDPLPPAEHRLLEQISSHPNGVPKSQIPDQNALASLLHRGYLEPYPPNLVRTVGSRQGQHILIPEDLDDLDDPLELSADPSAFWEHPEEGQPDIFGAADPPFETEQESSPVSTDSNEDDFLLELIDDLDEDDDTIDLIADASTMEDAYAAAATEILAYAEEIGEDPGVDEVDLIHNPQVRSWVEDIRSGIAED